MPPRRFSFARVLLFCASRSAIATAYHHQHRPPPLLSDRRSFLVASVFATGVVGPALAEEPPVVIALAEDPPVVTASPSRAFVVSSTREGMKTILENDATRLLTDARIVVMFGSTSQDCPLAGSILKLAVTRKKGGGADVGPGNVKLALPLGEVLDRQLFAVAYANGIEVFKVGGSEGVVDLVKSNGVLGEGDVLIVGGRESKGYEADAKVVEEIAARVDLAVGTERGGGVVGLLMNGARSPDNIPITENEKISSYSLLWYDDV